jgi:hypothetical protein
MIAVWPVPGSGLLVARFAALDAQLILEGVALLAGLAVCAVLLWWANRWRRQVVEPPESAGDQLSRFRQLYDQGELSREEFERIRGLLDRRRRQDLDVPPAQEPPDTGFRPGQPP